MGRSWSQLREEVKRLTGDIGAFSSQIRAPAGGMPSPRSARELAQQAGRLSAAAGELAGWLEAAWQRAGEVQDIEALEAVIRSRHPHTAQRRLADLLGGDEDAAAAKLAELCELGLIVFAEPALPVLTPRGEQALLELRDRAQSAGQEHA